MEREREREKELMTERRVTVLIPAGFLPFGRPKKLRIWGGGAVLAGAGGGGVGGGGGGLTQQQQVQLMQAQAQQAQLMQAQAQGVPSNVLVQMQAQMQAGMSLYDREMMMMAPGQQPPQQLPPTTSDVSILATTGAGAKDLYGRFGSADLCGPCWVREVVRSGGGAAEGEGYEGVDSDRRSFFCGIACVVEYRDREIRWRRGREVERMGFGQCCEGEGEGEGEVGGERGGGGVGE